MRLKRSNIDESKANEIINKLLTEQQEPELSYRTASRNEYEVLYGAADQGLFPNLLSITRKGLRLRKLLVHAPMRTAEH